MDRDFFLTRNVDAPAETRWYQFTLRRSLGAMTWAALWCGDFAFLRSEAFHNGSYGGLFLLGVLSLAALGPFLAVGTLIGHPFKALAIGVIASIIGVVLMLASPSTSALARD